MVGKGALKLFLNSLRMVRAWRGRGLARYEAATLYLGLMLVALAGLVLWGSIAEIDRVVRVSGRIIPAGRSQEIQHLEGGVVGSIDTAEGVHVRKGDLLLTINDAQAGSNLGETRTRQSALLARVARLQAESRGDTAIAFDAQVDAQQRAAEENLFTQRQMGLKQEMEVQQSLLRQQEARLGETSRRRGNLSKELQVASQRVKVMQDMAGRGAASKLEVLDSQSAERSLQTQMNEADASLPTIKAAIAEAQARLDAARTDFRSSAQSDYVDTMAELKRLGQVQLSAQDRLTRTEVRAPTDGIINKLAVNTIGGVVRPGQTVIELIPDTNEVLIEAKASPSDRGDLKPGLPATVRISAYDVGQMGTLQSKVTQVSADTLSDPDGTIYYRVSLLIHALPASYRGHDMVPGMTATADVVTGRRTFMGMLLSPLHKFTHSMFKDSR
jgi:adhesin transport system membrane fusion protein